MHTPEYFASWPVHSRMGFQGTVSSWQELNPGVIAVTPRLRQTAEQLSAEEMMLCSAFHGNRTECTGGLCRDARVIRTDDDAANPLDYFQTPRPATLIRNVFGSFLVVLQLFVREKSYDDLQCNSRCCGGYPSRLATKLTLTDRKHEYTRYTTSSPSTAPGSSPSRFKTCSYLSRSVRFRYFSNLALW